MSSILIILPGSVLKSSIAFYYFYIENRKYSNSSLANPYYLVVPGNLNSMAS